MIDLRGRASGVLLHLTSLPGRHGSGDLGAEARTFVDFLESAGQRFWQMLPVGPPGMGNSPYSARSAFAGNPMLISLDALVDDGLLDARDVAESAATARPGRVDYEETSRSRETKLRAAFAAFAKAGHERRALEKFAHRNAAWLDDFALFMALRREHDGAVWTPWDEPLRAREKGALAHARKRLADEIAYITFEQYHFAKQWSALRAYAAERGVGLIGDMPIFVAHDSADVWQHPDVFRLGEDGNPTHVAGVPPDYFSKTGQRWGNPLYRWKHLAKTGYRFWVDRLRTTLERFDAVRLDHFIGFARYWEIDAREPTAENGRWMRGPAHDLFRTLHRELGHLPLIAEDLGAVTESVKRLRDDFKLPGTRILQFAFGTDVSANDFLPHNIKRRAVVYTGTHDNDTIVGWFKDAGSDDGPRTRAQADTERRAAAAYVGIDDDRDAPGVHWHMIRLGLMSVARTAIFPVQDILGLGSEARMNMPGVAGGNWEWRLRGDELTPEIARELRRLTTIYGRADERRATMSARGEHDVVLNGDSGNAVHRAEHTMASEDGSR